MRVRPLPERLGFVSGKVSKVVADSTEVAEGNWALAVRIKPDQSAVNCGADTFFLRPSMTAILRFATDKRMLISHILAPIVDIVQFALVEEAGRSSKCWSWCWSFFGPWASSAMLS